MNSTQSRDHIYIHDIQTAVGSVSYHIFVLLMSWPGWGNSKGGKCVNSSIRQIYSYLIMVIKEQTEESKNIEKEKKY